MARPANTYRGARRNAVLRSKPKGVWGPQHYYEPLDAGVAKRLRHPPVRPNRSRKWKAAS